MAKPRVLIASDAEGKWYARRICYVVQDDNKGELIYHCDTPIANDLTTPEEALQRAKNWMARNPE